MVNNFGDLLGPLLAERIIQGLGKNQSASLASASPTLLAIGSIFHFAPPGAVIWGSGVNFKLATKLPPHVQSLDIRSVRGPYTARAVTAAGGRVPPVFGDPALLLPRFMPELRTWARRGGGGLLIAPNLNDFDVVSADLASRNYVVLDPREPLNTVLQQIAESGFVVGSSLHAIAIADSLGIPARFVASPAEGVLKYRDYLAGTGRPLTRIALDVDEAVSLGGHTEAEADLDAVLASFPVDLWKSAAATPPTQDRFTDHPSVLAAWSDVVAGGAFDEVGLQRRFGQVVFPAAVHAGEELLNQDDVYGEGPVRRAFMNGFAEAYAHRVSFAAGLVAADVDPSHRVMVPSLDSGDADRFLRTLWLNREGAHALFRAFRPGDEVSVLSLSLRPGTLVNDIAAIQVVCRDQVGREHVANVPVFAMYHRQWSIDISVSFEVKPGVRIASASVRMISPEGREHEVPIARLSRAQSALTAYPRIMNAPLWRQNDDEEDEA